MDSSPIYHRVQDRYGQLADRTPDCEQRKAEQHIAQAFGYDAADLGSIPLAANLGVSCGNPLALANLREVVGNRDTVSIQTQPNGILGRDGG